MFKKSTNDSGFFFLFMHFKAQFSIYSLDDGMAEIGKHLPDII